MNLTGLLIFLAIGAVAGWLAGVLMKGRGELPGWTRPRRRSWIAVVSLRLPPCAGLDLPP